MSSDPSALSIQLAATNIRQELAQKFVGRWKRINLNNFVQRDIRVSEDGNHWVIELWLFERNLGRIFQLGIQEFDLDKEFEWLDGTRIIYTLAGENLFRMDRRINGEVLRWRHFVDDNGYLTIIDESDVPYRSMEAKIYKKMDPNEEPTRIIGIMMIETIHDDELGNDEASNS